MRHFRLLFLFFSGNCQELVKTFFNILVDIEKIAVRSELAGNHPEYGESDGIRICHGHENKS